MNIKKRSVAYATAAAIYYVFDFIYMPWLVVKFGYNVFLPLGLSIWIANYLGVFAYDFFDEDVLFIELGKNWINGGEERLQAELNSPIEDSLSATKGSTIDKRVGWCAKNVRLPFHFLNRLWTKGLLWALRKNAALGKRFPKTADAVSFVALSIFPSPIAGYIAFRERIGEGQLNRLLILAIGSVLCVLVWGGLLSIAWSYLRPIAMVVLEFITGHSL